MTNPYEHKRESDPDEPNYWLNDLGIFFGASVSALITVFCIYLFIEILSLYSPLDKLPTHFDKCYTLFTFFFCTLLFMWCHYDEVAKSKQKTRKDL